ncbi:hypothetical protein CLV63_12281 [Murinocardiopsis flavida]|uniref:DUF2470 domain-containing protein n=1 Tax=Murinocardiopsis flavida TaxID=645275 RepID=A0A2P8D018_9ACTN|nr:DUF2470 domain-containing protein [Murinocardiopsis flavida]PSK90547.1 hypothetical protein CLV63_12281 [Murinocardiopsis flavida]
MRQPSPPEVERIRSLATTATPTTVAMADDPSARFSVRGAVDHAGRVVLKIDTGHPLHELPWATLHECPDLAVSVDLSALRHVGQTPTVRARLWCEGWLSAVPPHERRAAALAVWERTPEEDLISAVDRDPGTDAPLLVRIAPTLVFYATYDTAGVIDGDLFRAARPDPLTDAAERLLGHANDCHRDELAAAARGVADVPDGSTWLWELDSRGATLWVAPYSGSHPVLVRVPWSARAGDPHALRQALGDLLTGSGAAR